ncbi:hypothetical protein D3C85_1302620 [compost metagenome]
MSAVLSECGLYRYRLDREVQPEGLVFAYFGINPSTADASIDDSTVRKWRGFTLRNGGKKFIVGNVFAFRSTDPKALEFAEDPFGPDRYAHLEQIIAEADVLVPCWGNSSKVPPTIRPHIADLLETLLGSGKPVMHFGLTASGDPKHPLMLSYDTPLLPWTEDLV